MDRQSTTCPRCGASNGAEARWCGQCYAPFEQRATRGWTCRVCKAVNEPGDSSCSVCGTSIYDSFSERPRRVPARTAWRASAVPGMGLVRVGRAVEGYLTATLTLFALVSGMAVILAGNGGGWVLMALAAGMWAVAARDAVSVASGRGDPWLDHKTLSGAAGLMIVVAAILVLRAPLGGRP